MKYTGRMTLFFLSIIASFIESFSEKTSLSTILEAASFAAIAFLLGWVYDKAIYYRNKAEISKTRLRDILKFSPEPIIVYQNEKIVFVNEKFEQLIQSSSTEIIGKSILLCVLPEYHTTVKKRLQDISEGKNTQDRVTLKINTFLNHVLDIEISSAQIVYNNKPAVEVILRDVTERNRLEEELRKNEGLYRFITENTTDLISYIYPNGCYGYISSSSKCMLDYHQDELIGRNLYEFLHLA
jgi:PAS domain S-box-containing protein